MSIRLMSAVWDHVEGLTSTQAMVLLALADQAADDTGRCWPAIPRIASRARLSERSVYRILSDLAGQGHITIRPRSGKSTIYLVHPRVPGGSLRDRPLTQRHPCQPVTPDTESPTPDSVSPKPSRTTNLSKGEPLERARARDRAQRIPPHWSPLPLSDELEGRIARWPPGRLDDELARFRDHFTAMTGPGALRRDWDAVWRNWLRRADDWTAKQNGQHDDGGWVGAMAELRDMLR